MGINGISEMQLYAFFVYFINGIAHNMKSTHAKERAIINMKLAIFLLAMLATFASAIAKESLQNDSHTVIPSEEIRSIYNKEMAEILKGMESLVVAVVSANWDKIARVGNNIEKSYYLDSMLSIEQKLELETSLPKKYKDLDYRFHHYASMVAEGAAKKDIELVNYYIYKMNEVCTTCHAEFASERFQQFAHRKPEL